MCCVLYSHCGASSTHPGFWSAIVSCRRRQGGVATENARGRRQGGVAKANERAKRKAGGTPPERRCPRHAATARETTFVFATCRVASTVLVLKKKN